MNAIPQEYPMTDQPPRDLLAGLNPVQREAVLHEHGPLLILAGAGSGKTRVITHRIAYLVRNRGVRPYEILAITFTNKAAGEMRDRLESLLGFAGRGMWIGTFHAMMLRILRQHADRIGYGANFTILDRDDQERILREIIKEMRIEELKPQEIINAISSAKNRMLRPADLKKTAGHDRRRQQIAEIYERYQEAAKRANGMDFDDILMEAVELLRGFPEILEAYQTRFRHVLVDEYQDTNHVQYLIVRLLSGKHKNLCVVGDDDQSIYGFRGANIQNILDFEHDFKNTKVIRLEQNYRSTGTILNAANAVIRRNEARKEKRLWTEKGLGEKITYYEADNQYAEGDFVAHEIKRLMRGDDAVKGGNIGILYRVNALSRSLEFALRENGIQYSIYGEMRFYDRKEIRDILAYLRLIYSPEDDMALRRVVNTPKRGIGDVTLDRIRNHASRDGISMMDVMARAHEYPDLSRAAGTLRSFHAMMTQFRAIMERNEMSLRDFIDLVERESGLIDDLLDQADGGVEDAKNRIENLKELLSDAVEFEHNLEDEMEQLKQMAELEDSPDPLTLDASEQWTDDLTLTYRLGTFLERSALYSDLDQEDADQTVRMMAIHSAKGLEFDVVFLVGAEEGLFPGHRAFDQKALMEEERRLAYVAITRARKKLYITSTRSRLLYGQTRYNLVSRFVSEIPDEYIDAPGGRSGSAYADQSGFGSSGKVFGGGGYTPSGNNGGSRFGTSRGSGSGFGSSGKSPFVGGYKEPTGTKSSLPQSDIDPDSVKIGDRLNHKKFGTGVVRRIDPVADDAILTMDFNGKTKRLLIKNSPLEKI